MARQIFAAKRQLPTANCYNKVNPLGRRPAAAMLTNPFSPWKTTAASGPNSKITWRQAPQGEQGTFCALVTATARSLTSGPSSETA